jgi:hypothetical protein
MKRNKLLTTLTAVIALLAGSADAQSVGSATENPASRQLYLYQPN